jgi:beta-RFAP synthase
MILEGLVTTVSGDGLVNLAPMGPIVDEEMSTLVLRPFQTSTTFANLVERPEGVFHVTDDVLLLARAAIGTVDPLPEMFAAEEVAGQVVAGACRWYEFRIEETDTSSERTTLTARIVHSGRIRDYFGLHRARHAVLEAAILVTRVHLLPPADLVRQFSDLAVVVDKTAGPAERQAFGLLEDYLGEALGRPEAFSVSTGSRLHFGLLAYGGLPRDGGRQFGGAGMMIDEPGVCLQAVPDVGDSVVIDPASDSRGVSDRDIERMADWLATARGTDDSLPGCRIEVSRTIPSHSGLGSGTQLALAVARAVAGLHDSAPSSIELASRVGRGRRSGIGIHGFDHGGFLVDSGGRDESDVAPLVARVDVPDEWRIVLAGPETGEGLSGEAEREAFVRCGEMPGETTGVLTGHLLQRVLPALHEADIEEAGEGLYEFGRLVGDSFAAVQGGCYVDSQMAALVDWARGAGIRGVGQSSWGPTIWMLVPNAAVAESVATDVAARPGVGWCRVVRPLNRGADVRPVIGQPRRTFSKSG